MEGNTVEAYDKNNGLLLCGNIDAYFDKFDISFDEEGRIMIPDEVDKGIKEIIKDCCIDKSLLTNERLLLLDYHRTIYNKSIIDDMCIVYNSGISYSTYQDFVKK